ncbi:helix-turn-helix transcriptional regulator [Pseudoalteromonas sp.]|uniref:helix-turn-helix domain-containing protein n=1 Tax=Pseudoalteromonas sp. TaxID=53249 RepID=UPI002633E537|nr:helix-turn-helix transcriptional regulator [Pseudoalteromonas sp.]
MNLIEAFGQVLKQLRKEKGLSQEKLAELCGLDRTYVSMLERGKRQPTLTTIFKIGNVLHIKPYKLVLRIEESID